MKCLVAYVLYVTAAASVIGLLAPLHWVFDLFNHFRLHAVFASLVLCVAAALFHKALLRAAALLLLFNAVLVLVPLYRSGGMLPLPSDAPKHRLVRVVSSNVYTANTQFSRTMEILTAGHPDIIVLMEPNARWIEALVPLKKTHPHTLIQPRENNFGMAIYSKLPFEGRMIDVGSYALPLALAEFKDFSLIVAHPIPPLSRKNREENRVYLAHIAAQVQESTQPVLLAGDLNATLWSNGITPLLDAGLKRINPWGIAYSWPTHSPLFAMQIDHFFGAHITHAEFKVLPFIGSDHYPIQATFLVP